MAKTSVAPKRPRTKILLPLRVKRDLAYIELRLTHLRHEPPAASAGGAAGVG